MMANGSLLYSGEPGGHQGIRTIGSNRTLPKPSSLHSQEGLQPGPPSPTQLSPEVLSHRPPLGLITLTLLVNGLHNQVHDVEQDPGNKRQLIRGQDGGSREHSWLPHIPPDMRKVCTRRLAGAGVEVWV